MTSTDTLANHLLSTADVHLDKTVVVDNQFLTLNLRVEEDEQINLTDFSINLDDNRIPKSLINGMIVYAEEELEQCLYDNLDGLNNEYPLIDIPTQEIAACLPHLLRKNHEENLTNVQAYIEETLEKHIKHRTFEYLYDQLPNIPKSIQTIKPEDNEGYYCRFDGFVYWDPSTEDVFISDEFITDKSLYATINLKLAFSHPLVYIHYFDNYRKKDNNK